MNKLVWINGQRGFKGGNSDQEVYGKNAKRFPNNSRARAYAIKLGREKGIKVYDRGNNKFISTKKARPVKRKNPFDINFGF